MIFFFMVLGATVSFIAGRPLMTYVISRGNMVIAQGAPMNLSENNTDVTALKMNQKSTLDQSEIQVPEVDSLYGTISCERIELSAPVYYGDNEEILESGVGNYVLSGVPGEGRPILMSAHDATFFAPLEIIEPGDEIVVTTDYGTYTYSVASTLVAEATDKTAYDLTQEKEQLILYTCYPFGQLVGMREERYFVYCDLVASHEY